jgi:hypothetical protein
MAQASFFSQLSFMFDSLSALPVLGDIAEVPQWSGAGGWPRFAQSL